MKKLMIALAAVAVGFAANAAATNWQWNYSSTGSAVTAFESETPTATISGDMYVIFGFTGSAAANTSKDNLITQLRSLDSGWDTAVKGNANYLGNNAAISPTGVGKATLDKGQLSATVDFLESAESAVKQYAYAVILATDSKGQEWAYISASANATPGVDLSVGKLQFGVGTTSVYDLDATQTGKQAGWYQLTSASSPVPEPTSGLLLLLGVAGLALRRKQK